MATAIDEVITRISKLSKSDRDELIRRLNEASHSADKPTARRSNGSHSVHPNTTWIKENKHRYPGQYVALKDGKLIAVGRTIKEADLASKAKGVADPLLHYILPEGYVPWGGW